MNDKKRELKQKQNYMKHLEDSLLNPNITDTDKEEIQSNIQKTEQEIRILKNNIQYYESEVAKEQYDDDLFDVNSK
jgi:hypothetical protein